MSNQGNNLKRSRSPGSGPQQTGSNKSLKPTPNVPLVAYSVPLAYSELKSSLLIQELIMDENTHNHLLEFLQDTANKIYNIMGYDINQALPYYMNQLKTNIPGTYVQKEAVAQSHVWTTWEQIWEDVYALTNFLQWTWFCISDPNKYKDFQYLFGKKWEETCDNGHRRIFDIINCIQQRTVEIFPLVRGDRQDHKDPNVGLSSRVVGVTDIPHPRLPREIPKKPDENSIKEWVHWGKNVCNFPYSENIMYNNELNGASKYKESNKYSSLLCGISGSSQYTLFIFLCSISAEEASKQERKQERKQESNQERKQESKQESKKNMHNVIMIACITLIGAGGHNVREVLTGLVLTIIFLHHMLGKLRKEFEAFKNPKPNSTISDFCKGITDLLSIRVLNTLSADDKCQTKNFEQLYETLERWEEFINTFYISTSRLNVVGGCQHFIDKNIQSIGSEKIDKRVYDIIFNKRYIQPPYREDSRLFMQLFFAKDCNRYKNDIREEFLEFPNRFMKGILTQLQKSTRTDINDKILEQMVNSPTPHPDSLWEYILNKSPVEDEGKNKNIVELEERIGRLKKRGFENRKTATERITEKNRLIAEKNRLIVGQQLDPQQIRDYKKKFYEEQVPFA
jgi:hypothetical protein